MPGQLGALRAADTAGPPPQSQVSEWEKLTDESLLNVVESYVRYYASGDGHTARAKRYDLEHFLKFLAGPGGLPELLESAIDHGRNSGS